MSEDSHSVGLAEALRQQAPWAVAALAGAWAWALRMILGRALKAADQTAADISDIQQRLARIEGHLGISRHWDDAG